MMSTALDMPFRIDGTGRVATTRSLRQEIIIRLKSIIGTSPEERVMRAGYGAGARNYVFDSNDETLAISLASRVRDEINLMEPAVIVEAVRVEHVDRMSGLMALSVNYRLRSTGEILTAVVNISPTTTSGWPS